MQILVYDYMKKIKEPLVKQRFLADMVEWDGSFDVKWAFYTPAFLDTKLKEAYDTHNDIVERGGCDADHDRVGAAGLHSS